MAYNIHLRLEVLVSRTNRCIHQLMDEPQSIHVPSICDAFNKLKREETIGTPILLPLLPDSVLVQIGRTTLCERVTTFL